MRYCFGSLYYRIFSVVMFILSVVQFFQDDVDTFKVMVLACLGVIFGYIADSCEDRQ